MGIGGITDPSCDQTLTNFSHFMYQDFLSREPVFYQEFFTLPAILRAPKQNGLLSFILDIPPRFNH